MSGRHRRSDADTDPPAADPPDIDLARRLAPGPEVAPAARGATVPASRVVPRRDRAAERARRRAEARRRAGLAAGVLVVVALAVAAGWWVLTGDGGEDGTVTAGGPARQRTLLLQVTGPDGVAAGSALIGLTAAERSASVVLVPSGVLVDVAGTGSLPFGETTTLPEASAPAQALTDLVGVRVDDSWVLTPSGLAALVDLVGGVRAAVDVDVVRADGEGNETVVVRAGSRQLEGASAAAYATFLADGEPEQARLARFDDVLTAVAGALPVDRSALDRLVGALGAGSRSTLDPEGLADRLADLRAAAAGEALVSDVLPVSDIDSGGGAPTYGIDPGQVAAVMRARFPGALQTDPDGAVLRVLVENGVGTPGLVEQARERLVGAGFRFVNGGNATDFTGEPSSVIIPDGTRESVTRGQRVASALGLPASSIATSDRGQTVADVIVILGSDFAP